MFELETKDGISILKITGEIDISNAHNLKKFAMENILNKGNKNCILDLSQMNYIDSSGLGILVSLHKSFKLQGGELVLVKLSDNVKNLFRMTNLDKALNIKNSVNEALKFLKS
ncbi:anti-sigma factor antagonist [Thermosipho affectus]|uniref:Anti-sigma factor antagonist n=1 Tax=Thermosipho affectus TaxID=660294 RepID=A0ABX3II36_9BACT|nr:STAS domain-containing protein [Thermosipho affectus]ONN26974.1 anti-sigma factor antagonist [Thermosipho affectus]